MTDKAQRGTKRTCQSGSCGQRFYDLNRDPVVCPICGSRYVIAHGPVATVATARAEARRPARKAEPVPALAPDAPEAEADDALADVEGGEEIADSEDETFLEEEDEGGDVSGIVGGPSGEDEET